MVTAFEKTLMYVTIVVSFVSSLSFVLFQPTKLPLIMYSSQGVWFVVPLGFWVGYVCFLHILFSFVVGMWVSIQGPRPRLSILTDFVLTPSPQLLESPVTLDSYFPLEHSDYHSNRRTSMLSFDYQSSAPSSYERMSDDQFFDQADVSEFIVYSTAFESFEKFLPSLDGWVRLVDSNSGESISLSQRKFDRHWYRYGASMSFDDGYVFQYQDQSFTTSLPCLDDFQAAFQAIKSQIGMSDSVGKSVEKLVLWLNAMYQQTTVAGMLSVTALYVSSVYSKSSVTLLIECAEAIFGTTGFVNQASTDPVTMLRVVLETWKDANNSELGPKIKKLITYMICCGMTDSIGVKVDRSSYDEFYKESGMSKLWGPDIVVQSLETALLVWDKGWEFWATQDIKSVFMSGSAAVKCDQEHAVICAAVTNYIDGTLPKIGMSEPEFDLRLETLLSQTKSFHSRARGPERHVFVRRLSQLEKIVADLASYRRESTLRVAPFAVKLFGPTAQGKTVIADLLSASALKALGYDNVNGKSLVVSVNADDKYQSEIQTKHVVVRFDDMANTKADKQQGNPAQLLIDSINNEVKNVLKADLGEKGKVFWNCKAVIVTTNVEDLDAGFFSNEPAAVMRRLNLHITMTLKPEFAKPTQGSELGTLNPAAFGGEVIRDAWNFDVKTFTCIQGRGGGHFNEFVKYQFMGTDAPVPCQAISLHQLTQMYMGLLREHVISQENFIRASSDIYTTPMCEHDTFASLCPLCAVLEPNLEPPMENQSCTASVKGFFLRCFAYVWVYAQIPLWQWISKFFTAPQHFAIGYVRPVVLTSTAIVCATTLTFIPLYVSAWLFNIGAYVSVPVGVIASCATVSTAVLEVRRHCANMLDCMSLQSVRQASVDLWRNKYTKIVAACGVVVACVKLVSWWRTYKGLATSSYAPNGSYQSVPIVEDELPVDNPWATKQPVHTPQRAAESIKTMTLEQATSVISRQMGHAVFKNAKQQTTCAITMVRTNVMLVPYHVSKLSAGCPTTVSVKFTSTGNAGGSFSAQIDSSVFFRIGQSDLALLYVGAGGSRSDLFEFFPVNPVQTKLVVTEVFRSIEGEILTERYPVWYRQWQSAQSGYAEDFHGLCYHRKSTTFMGLCGAVQLSNRFSPEIVGVHVKGCTDSKEGVSCSVSRTEVLAAYNAMVLVSSIPTSVDFSDTRLFIPNSFGINVLDTVHPRSPTLWLPNDATVVSFGAHDGKRRKPTSRVLITDMSPLLEKHCGQSRKHGPSSHIGTRKIWYDNLLPMTEPRRLPPGFVEQAYQARRAHIFGFLDSRPDLYDTIVPLDLATALSGMDGVNGIDRMVQNTSMGFPWCGPKSDYFFPIDPTPTCTAPLDIPEDMQHTLAECEDILASGKRIGAIFYGCPKDEPTKIDKEKVRIFAACPWYLSILVRKYFLPISCLYLRFPEVFGTAVGINAYGPAWERLVKRTFKHGSQRGIFGDYAKFDKEVSYQVAILPWLLWIEIAMRAGYTSRQLDIMRSIAEEVCRPIYEWNGELLSTDGSTPSGHNMTVFTNSEINFVYMLVTWFALGESEGLSNLPNFFTHVSMTTYGDDNAMTVSPDVSWFNHVSVSQYLASYNISYTTADKTVPTEPYSDVSEFSFLKRAARHDAELDQIMAPLEIGSIFKSLHCWKKGCPMTKEEYMAEAVDSAMVEFFQHGREVYNQYRGQLLKVVFDAELGDWLPNKGLLTYDQQMTVWLTKYRPVLPDPRA